MEAHLHSGTELKITKFLPEKPPPTPHPHPHPTSPLTSDIHTHLIRNLGVERCQRRKAFIDICWRFEWTWKIKLLVCSVYIVVLNYLFWRSIIRKRYLIWLCFRLFLKSLIKQRNEFSNQWKFLGVYMEKQSSNYL